jgi:hypothetical protein
MMLSLLGMLILAGSAITQSAGAVGPSGDQAGAETPTSTEVSEGATLPDPGAEAAMEPEEAQEVVPVPPPEETQEVAPPVPWSEEAREVAPVPPPEETQEVVPVPPAEETEEVVPVPPAEETQEVVPAPAPADEPHEVVHAGASTERASEGPLSPLPANAQDFVPRNSAAEEAAPSAPSALIDSLVAPSTVAGPGEPSAGSHAAVAPVGVVTETVAGHRAQELSCKLSAPGGPATDSCAAGSMVAQAFLSASHAGFDADVASLAAATGSSPPGGGHGGSAIGSPPVSPTPGPAPGGASGSATGASGFATSGFFTLAGLLLLAAPRAMRRLRLSCQPWCTACFALIPERPG